MYVIDFLDYGKTYIRPLDGRDDIMPSSILCRIGILLQILFLFFICYQASKLGHRSLRFNGVSVFYSITLLLYYDIIFQCILHYSVWV